MLQGVRNDTGDVRKDKNETGGWVIDTCTKVDDRGRTDMKNGPNKQRERENRKAALDGGYVTSVVSPQTSI